MEVVDDLDAILGLPNHPLARLGMDSVGLATELDAAISTLQLALGKEGLPFEGTWRRRGLYAHIHRPPPPASIVPEAVGKGEPGALTRNPGAGIRLPQGCEYDAAPTAPAPR